MSVGWVQRSGTQRLPYCDFALGAALLYPTYVKPMAFFQFEQDFVASLRCIPMQVRLNLDTCGIKLKLDQWNHFTQADRLALLDRACTNPAEAADYRQLLQDLIQQRTGQTAQALAIDPAPPWLDGTVIPAVVVAKAASVNQSIDPAQWAKLAPLQRFALIKLSRSSHENPNFIPALREFEVIDV
jgi:hypothetical protein